MKPVVAIVGRPNVGKSTLFNKLAGRKRAIVHDEPGVTRDRHYANVTIDDRTFALIDTGGFDPTSEDPMKMGIKRHIDAAIAEADVIVCVFDAMEPATATDHAELDLLRKSKKPVIFVANKADAPKFDHEALDFFRLGIHELLTVSALHGRNIDDLRDAILHALPAATEGEAAEPPFDGIKVAVIGKPNAGKSSLVNRLLGEERMLVDDRPGTTRDAIDSVVERNGKRYLFVDTAGIRRKAKVTKEADAVEGMSVIVAVRAMERADVVVLVADANEGVAEQDAKVLGLAVDRGRGIVIALNKLDLLEDKSMKKLEEAARDKISFAPFAPVIAMSAKKGRGLDKLLETIDQVGGAFKKRVTTGELNRFFEKVIATRSPPTQGGKAPRLFFITQAETEPPHFIVVASDPNAVHFSYQRYVSNQIRKAFGFDGVPLKITYRPKRKVNLAEKDKKPTKPRKGSVEVWASKPRADDAGPEKRATQKKGPKKKPRPEKEASPEKKTRRTRPEDAEKKPRRTRMPRR